MRTAIKLILLNLLIAQIIAPILVMIPCVIYLVATTGNLDKDTLITMLMIPAQLAGQLMMGIYLWKAGYISTKKITWSPVSSSYLFFSALAVLTCGFVVSALAELMKWIPQHHGTILRYPPVRLGRHSCHSRHRSRTRRTAISRSHHQSIATAVQPDKGDSAFSPFIRCFPYQSCPDTSGIPDRYPVCMDVLQDCQPHPPAY